MNSLLIAGTDTDVGKTVFTSSLIAYALHYHRGRSLGLMKLIQTGQGDREWYEQIFGSHPSLEIIVPLQFTAPLAPPIAARQESRTVDLAVVWQAFRSLGHKDLVVVEALGGLGSPVTDELTVADLAREWRLRTVLVVPVRLGAIASAVANVALARQMKIDLVGIILNCVQPMTEEAIADLTPIDLIQSLTGVPILGTIPHLTERDNLAKLAQIASNCDLEILLWNNREIMS